MDELKLKLSTKFMKGIIAGLISKALVKKLGCNIDILLNEIEVKAVGGKIQIHADVDAETTNDDLIKLIKTVGLD